MFFVLRLVIIF